MFTRDNAPKACRGYEARLEDYLEGTLASSTARQVESHLAGCQRCREALEPARVSRELFDAGRPVAPPEPRAGFVRRVMLAVDAEERRRASGSSWWKPLESLSWRFSWSTILAMTALILYVVGLQVARRPQPVAQQTEVQDIFPESAPHPSSQDDVLLMLASANTGNNHGK